MMNGWLPRVSVVIPTRDRAVLLRRALESALRQTMAELELIVVVDGADALTRGLASEVSDSRVRWVWLEESVGGGEARNRGVRESRGDWIAFLDDDDEWLPDKLALQMAGLKARQDLLFMAGRCCDRAHGGVQPARLQRKEARLSEFLFAEVSCLGRRQSFLQTSTWIVERQLMLEVPFTKGMRRNQDTDWLLRAGALIQNRMVVVNQVLSIFHADAGGRVSRQEDWRSSREWALSLREELGPRALSYLLVTECIQALVRRRDSFHELFGLWRDISRYGQWDGRLMWLFVLRGFVGWPAYGLFAGVRGLTGRGGAKGREH